MDGNETTNTKTTANLTRGGDRIRVAEIAVRLDVGRLAVYAMLENGQIPAVRVGRKWLVGRASFERWLATAGEKVA